MEPTAGTARRAIVSVALAMAVIGFTTTAVTVGTRGMARELGLDAVELSWVVNAYLVSAAAFVVAGARLGDVIGRVRTYGLGLVVFAVGSLLGVVAEGFTWLVVARVVQGLGAALVLPSSIEVLAEYSTRLHRAAGFRWRGLVFAASFAVGPLVGGVLTDWHSWRWIFVAGGLTTLASVAVAFPLRHRPGRGVVSPTRDFGGAMLLAALVAVALVLGERLPAWGLGAAITWVGLGAFVGLAALLMRHERRTVDPLIHLSLLGDRRLLGADLATIGAALGMLSLLYFFNLFAQSAATIDAEVLEVLLALLPFGLSMWGCAVAARRLGERWGPRGPTVLGLVLMVAGFAALSRVSTSTLEAGIVIPLAVSGIGAGIANASLTGAAVLELPAGRANEAAGWMGLSRFVGSAVALGLGTAAFLSVPAVTPPVAAERQPAPAAEAVSAFDVAVANLDRDLSGPVLAAADETTSSRFARTMGLTAIVLAVITVAAAVLMRSPPSSPGPAPASGRGRAT